MQRPLFRSQRNIPFRREYDVESKREGSLVGHLRRRRRTIPGRSECVKLELNVIDGNEMLFGETIVVLVIDG